MVERSRLRILLRVFFFVWVYFFSTLHCRFDTRIVYHCVPYLPIFVAVMYVSIIIAIDIFLLL